MIVSYRILYLPVLFSLIVVRTPANGCAALGTLFILRFSLYLTIIRPSLYACFFFDNVFSLQLGPRFWEFRFKK